MYLNLQQNVNRKLCVVFWFAPSSAYQHSNRPVIYKPTKLQRNANQSYLLYLKQKETWIFLGMSAIHETFRSIVNGLVTTMKKSPLLLTYFEYLENLLGL